MLSNRIQSIAESETLAMQRRSRELRAQGKDIISLSIGEPDYNTPDFIKEAAKRAIDENYSHYPPVAGFAELKEAICLKFKRDNGLEYQPNQIVVSTGAKQSIANVVMSLVNPGDEVVIPAPYWVSYADMVRLAGGIPTMVYAGVEQGYKVMSEQVERAITARTKLIMFNSPSNPTGALYSYDEWAAMAEMLQRYPDIVIISDEIYEHIRYNTAHISLAAFEGMMERTITVNGLSKAFAMTGYRLGYIGAAKWIADACDKFQGQITSGANSIAQRAAIAALTAAPNAIDYMVEGFRNRRDLVYGLLSEIQGLKFNKPDGAFYYFINIEAYLNKIGLDGLQVNNPGDLSMYLLNRFHLATVSGMAFGCNKSIRISYACGEETLVEACKRLKAGLESLQ